MTTVNRSVWLAAMVIVAGIVAVIWLTDGADDRPVSQGMYRAHAQMPYMHDEMFGVVADSVGMRPQWNRMQRSVRDHPRRMRRHRDDMPDRMRHRGGRHGPGRPRGLGW